MSTSVTMMLNDNAGATEMPTLLVKAKFHYTDPTRTRHGPDRTRTDFFCGETPLGPCGSGRVRVVEFSYNDASTSGLYLEVFSDVTACPRRGSVGSTAHLDLCCCSYGSIPFPLLGLHCKLPGVTMILHR